MLSRTGLGTVFEQALTPMLALLPSLTEEADSLAILEQAYPTLHLLGQTRFDESDRTHRLKAWDSLMRTGVVRGLSYASDYPRLAALLITEMGKLVEMMGIDAVKHLKVIISACLLR